MTEGPKYVQSNRICALKRQFQWVSWYLWCFQNRHYFFPFFSIFCYIPLMLSLAWQCGSQEALLMLAELFSLAPPQVQKRLRWQLLAFTASYSWTVSPVANIEGYYSFYRIWHVLAAYCLISQRKGFFHGCRTQLWNLEAFSDWTKKIASWDWIVLCLILELMEKMNSSPSQEDLGGEMLRSSLFLAVCFADSLQVLLKCHWVVFWT